MLRTQDESLYNNTTHKCALQIAAWQDTLFLLHSIPYMGDAYTHQQGVGGGGSGLPEADQFYEIRFRIDVELVLAQVCTLLVSV